MGLLDFIERGPERTEWLSDTIGGAVEYLTPPNLRPVVEMAAQFNPIQGMADSMTQFGVATDPTRSMEDRRNAAIGSAVEGLLAVAPAAMASKGYMKPVQASMEGLLGWSPAGQAVGDELGRFWVDETGSIRVWHGSPHDFDKFSMEHIGTGEGAQAYGHGLYFAESPDVARDYQQALALNGYRNDRNYSRALDAGLSAGEFDQFESLARQTIRDPDTLARAFFDWNDAWRPLADDPAEFKNIRDFAADYLDELPAGHLYEVNIDANPEDFLNWDAPLSEQPEILRRIEPEMLDYIGVEDPETVRMLRDATGYYPTDKGEDLYRQASKPVGDADSLGDHARYSDILRQKGIPGISYLDAGSRGAGDGTRNYVVFDEGLLSILSKDGK